MRSEIPAGDREALRRLVPPIEGRGVIAEGYLLPSGAVRLVAINRYGIEVAEAEVYHPAAFDRIRAELQRELDDKDPAPRLTLL